MRIAFYSPIAKPDLETPSGISRVGALLVRALEDAGHTVAVVSLPRSFEGKGDPARQRYLFAECEKAARNYLEGVANGREPRPDFWFSYHVYYKSPDWIGPRVAKTLNIPYVIAEASHAPKRAKGPWAFAHDGATKAIESADRLLAMTSFDRVCLEWIAEDRVRDLKPFIDPAPFTRDVTGDAARNLVIAVGMMRNERKLASYRLLAEALSLISYPQLNLEIAGDGPYRGEIEAMFEPAQKFHAVTFSGAVAAHDMPLHLEKSGVLAWPGIGEAYGLAYLEAQAAGLAVVACRDRGVPDVVREGETALLSEPGDVAAYADNLLRMITDRSLREKFGNAAPAFVQNERSIEAASRALTGILAEIAPR
jgi:glycosyltransferase involved in cell wall biosynthesis